MISVENNQIPFQEQSLIDSNPLFLGFVNKLGKLESSSFVGKPLLPKQKMEMLLMGLSLQNSMLRDFTEDFGDVNYTVTERKDLKFVSIPLDSGILFGVFPLSADHLFFVDIIRSILRTSKENSKNKEEVMIH